MSPNGQGRTVARCSFRVGWGQMKAAKLISQIPPERFRSRDGSHPRIGDVVMLDQGFTFPDGRPGGLVLCLDRGGNVRWEAEAYESELGPDTGD